MNRRRVSFDPLALLWDASLEGELELVKQVATQVPNPSAANDEGFTALHIACTAGHFEIVKFLVELGCDVNIQNKDGWCPIHCASSINNLPMVTYLIEFGACPFSLTHFSHETPLDKCDHSLAGFDACSSYIQNVQEKLGTVNNSIVYGAYSHKGKKDELSFAVNDELLVIRKGDEDQVRWWVKLTKTQNEGYVSRNLLALNKSRPLRKLTE